MQSILFITSRPIIGGAQKWTYEQAKLLQDDFNIFLSTAWEGWLSDSFRPFCKEVLIHKGLYTYSSFGYYVNLITFIKNHKIDTVVASSASAGIYARLLRIWFPRLHIVYVSHGWSSVYKGGKAFQLAERLLSFFTSKILVVSKSDYTTAVNRLKINPKKLVLIENGIYPLEKAQNEKPNTKYTLMMIARFEYPKKQRLLIEAAKKLQDIEVIFVGDGHELKELRRIAPENVKFLGARSDINVLLSRADVFVLLSESEGMPLSILEAMSVKKPLLLSNLSSLQGFIEGNGFLVNNKVEDIIEKINQLRTEDEKELGENSFKIFNAKYNILNNKDKYLELYENITHRTK